MRAVSLPERVKPDIGRQVTSTCSGRALRGGWGRRAPTDPSRNLRDPIGCPGPGAWGSDHRRRESITAAGSDRESEGDIVATTRGNARRAMVPGRIRVCLRREEIRLDNRPTTEGRVTTSIPDPPPAMPEVSAGEGLRPPLFELCS